MKMVNYASVAELYKRYSQLRKQDVEELDQWVRGQSHLPLVTVLFIHSNYYNMDAAKKTVEAYFTFRTSCKDFFVKRDITVASLQRSKDILALCALPESTSDGFRVIFAKVIDCDASKFSFASILKFSFICTDILLWEEGCAEGHVLIIDMNGLHLGHLPKLGIFTLKNFIYYIQEALPIRLKGIHLINAVPFIDTIMVMIRPFLKKELLDMFHIHQQEETVYPFVPQHILPKEYGGKAPPMMDLRQQLYDNVAEYRDYIIKKDRLQMVDESKRVTTRSFANMFGLF
ncbi:alpha-tocopherol transfer protein-like isoform X2 [Topomyia yanbarensis]|uniref:alpha-tocopherol transfer protein-like isoform X2 n=1 Tax=Topomyia yanbarensis TaxID=2498891 RepID=UPI00273C221B|nr:alpha-tocopherol transfer protein-like isoform X2 [Topomyia yanbarensis]